MDELSKLLVEGEPWVENKTRVDLLGQSEKEFEVVRSRKEMIDHLKFSYYLKT